MAFDAAEKERIRYHMGYPQVGTAASLAFGIPIPIQTMFLLEDAYDRVLPAAEDRVRKITNVLDNIECKMIEGQEYLVATQLDSMTIREDHIEKLEEQYFTWACRLADNLGCPLYPGSEKFRKFMGAGRGQAGSIPVTG